MDCLKIGNFFQVNRIINYVMFGFPTAEHLAELYLITGRTKNISEYDPSNGGPILLAPVCTCNWSASFGVFTHHSNCIITSN